MIFNNMSRIESFKRMIDQPYNCPPFAIISIQEPPNGNGFTFHANGGCMDVLHLCFDDADIQATDKIVLFSPHHARQIIDFVEHNLASVNEFVIACAAGISRSAAVAAALSKIYNNDDRTFFARYIPNRYVYRLLLEEYQKLR